MSEEVEEETERSFEDNNLPIQPDGGVNAGEDVPRGRTYLQFDDAGAGCRPASFERRMRYKQSRNRITWMIVIMVMLAVMWVTWKQLYA